MLPLIGIAVSVIPELVKLIAGDKAGGIVGDIANIVSSITGTTDPAKAQTAIDSDASIAAQLKTRLAELAVEATKTQNAEQDAARQAELDKFKAALLDTQSARSTMLGLVTSGSKIAYGAPIVSIIVTLGFFILLGILLLKRNPISDPNVANLLNLAVGALLSSFSAVVSYWIGSSQNSRAKDDTIATVLAQQTTQNPPVQLPPVVHVQTTKPDNFDKCLNVVLAQEGGYVDNPLDKGGPTKFGITVGTLATYRGTMATAADVQALTQEEAGEIYRVNYWLPMNCPALPVGIDLMVFDFGVNAGERTSTKTLQKVCGVTQDGSVGPMTLAALGRLNPKDVLKNLSEARLAYYQTLSNYAEFGKGWINRVASVKASAMAMMS